VNNNWDINLFIKLLSAVRGITTQNYILENTKLMKPQATTSV